MALAWSPPTPRGRPVRASVVILPDLADSNALVAWLPQAKGKFVLISMAQPTCRPDDSWEKWATQSTADSMKAGRTAAQQAWQQRLLRTGYVTGGGVAAAAGLTRRLEAAGAAGIIGSLWSQGWGVQKVFTAYTERGYGNDNPGIVTALKPLFNQDKGTGRVENMGASGFPDAAASLARNLARVPADVTRNIKFGFPGAPRAAARITRRSSRAARPD